MLSGKIKWEIALITAELFCRFSHVRLSATPWTMASQAPLSMGFSRKEYWSGLPFPSPVIKYEVSEVKSLSRVQLFATPWTAAYQAPPSMGFSRQRVLEWVAISFSKWSITFKNCKSLSYI